MDNYLIVNGEKLYYLFDFINQNKSYIVYSMGDGNISASIYKRVNGRIVLLPIESDDEWDLVDKMIEKKGI